jgi:hypothetical protein
MFKQELAMGSMGGTNWCSLGRGDDKSGCRDAWEAYCGMMGIQSRIKSFRSNRFNNYFEAAAALHYHRAHIQDLFSNYSDHLNLKLQSTLADCKSDDIDSMLIAVATTYFSVTGPYWLLITSSVKYLDLFEYFVPMHDKFVLYSDTPPVQLIEATESVIPNYRINDADGVQSLHQVPNLETFSLTLKNIFSGFAAVAVRQLKDFLPGGTYHDVQDPTLRSRMSHCQLTNLTGEAHLADLDLDYSLFTKRNATLHYRSFTNMMGRNKTLSSWFHSKTEAEQAKLLSRSRTGQVAVYVCQESSAPAKEAPSTGSRCQSEEEGASLRGETETADEVRKRTTAEICPMPACEGSWRTVSATP